MSVAITDNSGLFKKAKDEAIERALVAVGIHLEGESKDELENSPRRIDTGRLRGSIAFATSTQSGGGESPANLSDYTPRSTPEKGSVYWGTNVEYSPYVFYGTEKMAPNRFLMNAYNRNENQIKKYFEDELKGE